MAALYCSRSVHAAQASLTNNPPVFLSVSCLSVCCDYYVTLHTCSKSLTCSCCQQTCFLLFTANASHCLSVCLPVCLSVRLAVCLSACKSPDCASAGSADSTILAIQRGMVLSNCAPDVMTRVCIDVMVGIALVYFAITCALLMLKLSAHKKVAYRRIQVGTIFFRLQVSPQDQNSVSYVHNIMT